MDQPQAFEQWHRYMQAQAQGLDLVTPGVAAGIGNPADFVNMTPSERQSAQSLEATLARAGVTHDPVNHPKHYTDHPSGIECIQITEHMGFNLGNALKYIWRCDLKQDAIEDLKKAEFYIKREIQRRLAAEGK